MSPFAPLMRRAAAVAASLLPLGLVWLAGCGEKSVSTITPPPDPVGTVVIDGEPDVLDAPWALSGPEDFSLAGRGDTTLTAAPLGRYEITWGAVEDWAAPFPRTRTLEAGGRILFDGAYLPDDPFQEQAFGTEATLEVVTWNIEHFPKNGAVTVDLVARAILAVDADILALQEIESLEDFQDLDDRLADWTGVRAAGSAYQINLAFLYRNDGDWVVDAVEEIFTDSPREFPRPPFVMEGRFKGEPVVIINNHFKCCGDNYLNGDPWDEEVRRRDASRLLDQYVRTSYPGEKVLVVGDLNDSLTDEGASNVFQVFLDDPATWRFADLAIAQGPPGGWSFPGWPSHLDHILLTAPVFAAFEAPAAEVKVLPLATGFAGGWSEFDRNVSDHLPVAVKLIP